MAVWQKIPDWKKRFEVLSVLLTCLSLLSLLLEMELAPDQRSTGFWLWSERLLAAVFTAEYFFRWSVSHDRRGHPFRPMAVIDFISILPFYVGFFVSMESLHFIRSLRILRILRLYRYTDAAETIYIVFRRVRAELGAVALLLLIVVMLSSVAMFEVERGAQPDKLSKPSDAIWWSLVTVATVGYGDIAPVTFWGRVVATVTMLVGVCSYGVMMTLFGGAWIDVLRERRVEREKQEDMIVPS